MKRKYFGWERAFEFVWLHCDRDGLWTGDSSTIAAAFGVTENEAYDTLSDLSDSNLIERIGESKYAIVRWHERDEVSDEE
jgi:hypothetical protein